MTSRFEKCRMCEVSASETQLNKFGFCRDCNKLLGGAPFTNEPTFASLKLEPPGEIYYKTPARQKFEEIKERAWEMYKFMQKIVDKKFDRKEITRTEFDQGELLTLEWAWKRAEQFHKFAQQKEEEMENGNA